MARKISILKQSDNVSPYIVEYVVDTEADVALLPTDGRSAWPGSTAIVTENASVYILNNQNIWVKLG